MGSSHIPVPVRPLHVEIDGTARYRQAYSVEDLAALLLGNGRIAKVFRRVALPRHGAWSLEHDSAVSCQAPAVDGLPARGLIGTPASGPGTLFAPSPETSNVKKSDSAQDWEQRPPVEV